MRYLLDVNVLIALGVANHQFHTRGMNWVANLTSPELLTCPITELGFVRVLSNTPAYPYSVEQARDLLLLMKRAASNPLVFIPDDHDIARLPARVKHPRQTTDGHLLELARSNEAVFATFDEKIPGAHLIP